MRRSNFWSLSRPFVSPDSDAMLLGRFVAGDTTAFDALVHRHGGLVYGTGLRMLRDRQLAEDAFQATFAILARKGSSVTGLLPSWLHSVARRVCLRLQKQRRTAKPLPELAAPAQNDLAAQQELLALLDDEIARLPEKHRRVVMLCYLQNLTAEAASQQLGIPRGTVLSRLDAARRKLQVAFERRGISSLALLTVPALAVTVPEALAEATRRVLEHPPSTLTSFVTQEIMAMAIKKWLARIGVVLALFGAGSGLVWMTAPSAAQGQNAAVPKPKDDGKPAEPKATEKDHRAAIERLAIQINQVESELKRTHEDALMWQSARRARDISEATLKTLLQAQELKLYEIEVPLKRANKLLDEAKKQREVYAKTKIDENGKDKEMVRRLPDNGWDLDADVEWFTFGKSPVDANQPLYHSPTHRLTVAASQKLMGEYSPEYEPITKLREALTSKDYENEKSEKVMQYRAALHALNEKFAPRFARDLEPMRVELQDKVIAAYTTIVKDIGKHYDEARSVKDSLATRLFEQSQVQSSPAQEERIAALREKHRILSKVQLRLELEAAGLKWPGDEK